MEHEIHFSDPYLADLSAAIDNFWLVSGAAAQRFAEQHDARAAELVEFPRRELRHANDQYSMPIAKTGYRIVYEVSDARVTLVQLDNVRRRRVR